MYCMYFVFQSRRRTIYQPRKAPKNLNVEDNDPCSSSASQQTKGASAYSKFNTTFIVDVSSGQGTWVVL
jgi:hypothetical protein